MEFPMTTQKCGCPDFQTTEAGISRRSFLSGMLAVGGGLIISSSTGLKYSLAAFGDTPSDVIITLSMRGGMDGLMAVPRLGDPNMLLLRPTISVLDSQALILDRNFGLHPNLVNFKSLYDSKELAIVHAAGTPVGTRSHFDDQNALELAAYGNPGTTTGWQNRFLQAAGATNVLSGISVADQTPVAFYGASPTVTLSSLDDAILGDIEVDHKNYLQVLQNIHSRSSHRWSQVALSTLTASEELRTVKDQTHAAYPDTSTAERFKLLASLLNGNTPIKTASIDFSDNFDVHSDAGVRTGTMADNFKELDAIIAAFKADIGNIWQRVTIVTLTEFGRRLQENSSAGVDHGWASVIFVIGGGVKGGQVVCNWPGLEENNLRDGDLAVTTDYRHVLAEVMKNRGGLSSEAISAILPGFTPLPLGVTKPI